MRRDYPPQTCVRCGKTTTDGVWYHDGPACLECGDPARESCLFQRPGSSGDEARALWAKTRMMFPEVLDRAEDQ